MIKVSKVANSQNIQKAKEKRQQKKNMVEKFDDKSTKQLMIENAEKPHSLQNNIPKLPRVFRNSKAAQSSFGVFTLEAKEIYWVTLKLTCWNLHFSVINRRSQIVSEEEMF